MLRGALRATVAFGLFAAIAACASPTLPLPPPDEPVVTPSTQAGKFHLASAGGAEPNAIIVIVNQNTSLPPDERVSGSEADATGSWDAEVIASQGDILDITQEFGDTRSAPTEIQVP